MHKHAFPGRNTQQRDDRLSLSLPFIPKMPQGIEAEKVLGTSCKCHDKKDYKTKTKSLVKNKETDFREKSVKTNTQT